MHILFYTLLYVYAFFMGVSATILKQKKVFSFNLMIINVLSAATLSLTPFSISFFFLGISLLFLCSIVNGFFLNGFPNYKHLLIRFIFSLILLILAYK